MQSEQFNQRCCTLLQRLRASTRFFSAVLVITFACSQVQAGGMVRLMDKKKAAVDGKIVALTKSTCSIMDQQGRIHHKHVRELKSLQKLSSRFEAHPTSVFRKILREEFKGDYEVAGTTHYLVCAPAGRAAQYAKLFESIYRDVDRFYRVRGFRVIKPDVPLVAVVFRTQAEFAQYCRRDEVAPSSTLMGYYSLLSNRVALFDDANLLAAADDAIQIRGDSSIAAYAAISGNTAGTVIHETTHQVGYNIGVHSRLGETPVWVVEGLATVLEPAGMRQKTGRQLLSDRINSERADWFEERHRPSRSMGSLAKLIASDEYFFQSTLNSYSEAWALTFFIMENASRRQDFVKYLQKLGQRNVNEKYTATDRLADFQESFGDISRLEVEFIRYLDRM